MNSYDNILNCLEQLEQLLPNPSLTDLQIKYVIRKTHDFLESAFLNFLPSPPSKSPSDYAINSKENTIASPYDEIITSLKEWITITEASKITKLPTWKISKAVTENRIYNNGQKGHKRRVLRGSLLLFYFELRNDKFIKDSIKLKNELDDDARKIDETH